MAETVPAMVNGPSTTYQGLSHCLELAHRTCTVDRRSLSLFCLLAGYEWEDMAIEIPGRLVRSLYDQYNFLVV